MNEQVIDDLYNRAVSLGYKKDRNSYVKLIHSNPSVFNDSYSYVKSKGYKKSTNDFSELIGLAPKKKVTTEVSKPSVGSSVTTKTPQKQSSDSSKPDGIYKFPTNPKANYKKEAGQWYVDPSGGTKFQPLTKGDVAKRVKVLESQAKREFNPYLETEEKIEFKAETKQAKPTEKVVGVEKKAQDVFKKEFQALDENDPIVIQRNTQDKKTNELISRATNVMKFEEEEAIPALKKIFNEPGYNLFDFEETGAGDAVKVINKKTGESKVFAFDTEDKTEMDKLTAFVNMNVKYKAIGDLTEESKKLQEQINTTYDPNKKLELSRKLKEVNNKLKIEESVRLSDATTDKNKAWSIYDKDAQQNAKAKIDSQLIRSIDYREKKKDLDKRQSDLDAALKNNKITYEDYKTKYLPSILAEKEQLSVEEKEIKSANSDLTYESERLNEVAGYNMLAQAERGDFLSGISASFLKGVESPFRLIAGAAGVKTEKGFMMDELLAGLATDEYISDEKRSDIEKALFSVSESLGAAAGGAALTGGVGGVMSGPGATLGTYALSYYSLKDEIDSDPDMANVSEGEKMFLSGIYGGVIGLLDKFGLSKSLSKNPLGKKVVNGIMSKVLTSLPKDATADMIEAAVNSEVKLVISKGIINTAGGFVNEGATEGLQEFADVTIRDLYNKAKGKELLDKPKTWGEIFERAGESFWLGGLGGAAMSGATQAAKVPKQMRTIGQLKSIERIIDNPDMIDIFTDDLKVKVLNGQMKAKDAKAVVNEMRESQAVFNMIPADVENKYAAFKLISEREFLSKEIEGKDPALVEDKKQRVNQIEEELRTLPKKQEVSVESESVIPDEISSLNDDEQVIFNVETLEEVPEQFRDRAVKKKGMEVTLRRKILGLPIGKETKRILGDGYRYELTGKEAKDYAIQNQKREEEGVTEENPLSSVEATAKALNNDLVQQIQDESGQLFPLSLDEDQDVFNMLSERYHEAKQNGNDPDLVNAFEKVLGDKQPAVENTTQDIDTVRAQEQAELIEALPNAEQYMTDGKVDRAKITDENDLKVFDEIYNKYDKIITEQADRETTGEVETEEEQRARLEELLSSKPKFQRESNPLNTNFDKPLINSLITNLRSKGEEYAIEILEAIRDGKSYDGGEFELSEVVDSIIANGLTFGNVVGLLKATTDYYSDLSTREIISKLSSIGDPNIGRIAKETIKFQNTEPIAPDNVEAIRKVIESIDSEVVNAEIPSDLTTKNKIDVKSLRSRFGDELKAAFKGGIIKSMSYFNGIPMTFSISDQLGSGIYINPITGNKFLLNGGLGFNLTKGNKFFAWANVEEKEAKDMLKRATDTYENNKDLFEKLWDEGTLPKGLVPVAIAKMGQDSILSNEALFRVAADIFKNKLPLENRVKALNVLSNTLNNNIDRIGKISKDKRSDANKTLFSLSKSAYEFIQENNFKSIDELFDNINNLKPIRARGLVSNLSFVGDVQLESTKKPGNPSKDVSKALVEGLDKSYNKFISAQFINDLIKEEATSNIPDQHIIAVVGVDVINPSIGTPNHRNYSAGVKGKLIGILENPVHAADVFPGFYARTFTMIKPDKSGKTPSMKQSIGQAVAVGGSIVNMKSLVGARVTSNMTDIQKLLAKLKLAFPSVTIADTVEEFNKALEDPSVKAFTRDGDIIYGFTKGNKVFLNPAIATENTAIHEFAHIWMGFLRQNNPKLLQKGFDLAKKSELYKQKLAENNGDVDLAAEETLAELIASKGEAIFLAAKDASNFKDWLNAMYTYIKTKIPGFKNLTPKQFENLTLEEFVDNSLNSLLSGKEVTQKEVKSIKVLFSKANMTAEEVIRVGRANRISDAVIDRYLQDNGFTGYETLLSTSKPQAKPRTELKDLENKIRLYARAKRETKQEIVSVIRNITDTIKDMITKGQMDRANFKYIMTKLSRVNFSKQDSVDAFINYVFKKMTDAEYTDKLKKIQTINKRIKSNKSMVEPIASTAKEFAKINPALVSNIDTHLALAEEINKSLTRYTKETDPTGIKFRENFDYNTLYNYVENNKNNILKKSKKELSDIYEAIFGVGSSNEMSDEKMSEEIKKAKESELKKLKGFIQQKISSIKAIVENDPTVSDLVKRAANVDVDYLNLSDAVDIVNALTMYLDNGFETGLNKLVANYEGTKAIADSKLQFAPIGVVNVGRGVAREYNDYFNYIEGMLDKKAKKVGDVLRFMKESALGLIQKGYNRSEYETNELRKQYDNKFKKVKKFFDPENKAERALLSYVQRNVSSNEGKAAEFLRRKELVSESIEELRNAAGKVNLAIANLQEEAAKKLGILKSDGTVNESITIDQINSRAEKSNLEAVKWIQDIWAKKYSSLYDHALGMHNTLIGRDEFYTPDRYSNIVRDIPADIDQMEFISFTGMTVNKSGVLIEAKRPKSLDKKFINMDFEDNNFGSYRAAMNDLYTAEARTKYKAYQSSSKFDDIMSRDKYRKSKDADLIRKSYLRYITAKENKGPVDSETDRKVKKFLGKVSTVSGASALASFKNVLAQTLTTYVDTIFATGPRNAATIFKDSFDPKVWAFVAKADSQVANRGVDAIKFTDKIKEEVMKRSKVAEATGTVFNAPVWASEQMLKYTNQKGDKLAAVGAWMTYYRKYCRKNGIALDFNNVNQDAAQYAETKTKIQILPSDASERGRLGASNKLVTSVFRQMLFPFSSFSINQKNRIYGDIAKILRGDFKLKRESFADLFGAITGLATFQTVNVLWKYYVVQTAINALSWFLDDEDEEALEKALESALKLASTQGLMDILSPIPILDPFVVDGINYSLGDAENNLFAPSEDKWLTALAEINQAREDLGKPELDEEQTEKRRKKFFEDEEWKLYVDENITQLDKFGVYGMAIQEALELKDIVKSAATGKYKQDYQGNITEKTLTNDAKEGMGTLALMKATGLVTGFTDLSNISQKLYYKLGKSQSLTDNQVKNTEEVKEWAKEYGHDFDKYAEKVIKIKRSAKEVKRAIMHMEDLSPKEKEEYIKTLMIN